MNLIKLENNDAMKRAVARAREFKMKATRVRYDLVAVKDYLVLVYAPKPGLFLADCNCKASGICKHIAAACVVPGTAICEALNKLQALPVSAPVQVMGAQPRSASMLTLANVAALTRRTVKGERYAGMDI